MLTFSQIFTLLAVVLTICEKLNVYHKNVLLEYKMYNHCPGVQAFPAVLQIML